MKTIRSLTVTGVACLVTLPASNALAFGVNIGDILKENARPESNRAGGVKSGSGFAWWSTFQDSLPEPRRPFEDAPPPPASPPPTGDWFDATRGAGSGPGLRVGGFAAELIGTDRQTRIAFIKEKFLMDFVLGWRFNRWFSNLPPGPPGNLPPGPPDGLPPGPPSVIPPPAAVIPLPAPLLLLGSALAGLVTFTRRSLRFGGKRRAD